MANKSITTDRNVLDIMKDYQCKEDILLSDDPRVVILKDILNNKLNLQDRTIILLYLEHQSYRKVGKKLCVSHMTARSEVLRVVANIRALYAKQSINL